MTFRKVEVTTVVRQIASYNPKRVCISITNYAGSDAFIHTNQTRVTTEGFPIAVGTTISLIKADGDDPREALWGQTVTGTADIRVQESWETSE